MPKTNPGMSANFNQKFTVNVVSDGTSTHAKLLVENAGGVFEMVGEGVARRHKGDRRDPEIGLTLAFARALADAAGRYRRMLEEMGYVV